MARKGETTKTAEGKIVVKKYLVTTNLPIPNPNNAIGIEMLKDGDKITREQIDNAGADFEWLLKTGALEDAGYE